jgi:hypothetical protein
VARPWDGFSLPRPGEADDGRRGRDRIFGRDGFLVTYSVTSQRNDGLSANVAITDLGDPLTEWQLTW